MIEVHYKYMEVEGDTSGMVDASRIIHDAEAQLRAAAAKAATSGAYDDVVVITTWAKTLQAMAPKPGGVSNDAKSVHREAIFDRGEPTLPGPSKKDARKVSSRTPLFSRDSDYLIKTARSRRTHQQYEHRASAEVINGMVDCLAEQRSSKKLITAEQLLQAYSKRKGSVVSYQFYVVLSWLTELGLLRRHGRRGYAIKSPSGISQDVQAAWAALESVEMKER